MKYSLDGYSTIKIKNINGVELPVFKVEEIGTPSEKYYHMEASSFFRMINMEHYTKALYIKEKDGIEFAIFGCYNFRPEKCFPWSTHFYNGYDVVKIKYDDRFDSKYTREGSSYDPGPKGDRLNSMNRTWYEND